VIFFPPSFYLNLVLKFNKYSGSESCLLYYYCSEADEIYKICSVLGTPTKDSWTDGLRLAMDINYQFPEVSFASPNPFE
jgi:hypothetical protein